MPGGRDQAMLFGLAVVNFTFCAFVARLVIDVLVRRHVLRRRLLIVGAGQRAWDLLQMLGHEGSSLHDDVYLVHDPPGGSRSAPAGRTIRPDLLPSRLQRRRAWPDGWMPT